MLSFRLIGVLPGRDSVLSSVVVGPDKVVSVTYILTDEEGHVLEERTVEEPAVFLVGRDQIIHSLERALMGQTPGYSTMVSVDPANGFGEYRDDLVMDMPRDNFPPNIKIEPGMKFNTLGPNGLPAVIRVIEVVDDEVVVVDGNHPLAGMSLTFDVRILRVRDATDAELESGIVDDDADERSDLH
jgi:FKBP-type peptidyl-prolyl cis-trans isomerase SlyD